MFGPYANTFHYESKRQSKAEASPAPPKNSACILMGFQWTEVYKDSLDKLNTEKRHIWLLAVYLLWKRVADIYIIEPTSGKAIFDKYI